MAATSKPISNNEEKTRDKNIVGEGSGNSGKVQRWFFSMHFINGRIASHQSFRSSLSPIPPTRLDIVQSAAYSCPSDTGCHRSLREGVRMSLETPSWTEPITEPNILAILPPCPQKTICRVMMESRWKLRAIATK